MRSQYIPASSVRSVMFLQRHAEGRVERASTGCHHLHQHTLTRLLAITSGLCSGLGHHLDERVHGDNESFAITVDGAVRMQHPAVVFI